MDTRLPIPWLLATVALTVAMFFWLAWHVYNSYRVGQEAKRIYIRGEEIRDRIVDFERQLENAAHMAVLTGDTSWEAEYRLLQPRLEAVILETVNFDFPVDTRSFLAQLQAAHGVLRAMEQQSLEWLKQGKKPAGLRYLSQAEYEKQRHRFNDAINGFIVALREHLADRLRHERNKEIASLFVAFLIFILSLTFWLLLIRRLHRWGKTLSKEITERRQAEEKYRNLFTYANDMIFIVDPATSRLLDVNEKAVHTLGYSKTELLQRKLQDIDIDTTMSCKAGGSTIPASEDAATVAGTCESTYRRKDGTTFPVAISGKLIPYGGKMVYQSFSHDLTERKRLQETLFQSHKMEAMGQLASGVAHDFNNLLTAISGYTALAKETLTPRHPAITSLEQVEQAAEQAASVTRALLTFSRKQPEENQPVELKALVQETLRLMQRILPASIAIVHAMDPAAAVWVRGDKAQLQQVLLNLVINAKDAMPEGGTLGIALFLALSPDQVRPADKPVVCLQVSDTGIGMTPEVRARLFEPFFSTKPKDYGTGLGLATVHGIVTRHDGWVSVASTPGRGSTFTVHLPVSGPKSVDDSTQANAVAPHGHGEMILLAEDQRYVREIMATTLQELDYLIVQVGDGPSLLEAFTRYRINLRLLIIDLDLPGKSGLGCLHEIRADDRPISVILTTGMADLALDGVLDDKTVLLRKPFQMTELGRLVSAMLAKSPGQMSKNEYKNE